MHLNIYLVLMTGFLATEWSQAFECYQLYCAPQSAAEKSTKPMKQKCLCLQRDGSYMDLNAATEKGRLSSPKTASPKRVVALDGLYPHAYGPFEAAQAGAV
ncbi:hypothetical protein BsWGS_28176 [Bradybaena similaris]